ncbi:MAG: YicC family protein [Paludibacteraceae bacterium]|nr:YicC family protein [Paludibacteraceae bacterium]
MLLSMTGYGKAECLIQNKKYIVELRSLNSKQMDISMRLASLFREKELDLRTILTQQLERGKIDCAILPDNNTAESATAYINTQLLDMYVKQLQDYANQNNLTTDVLAIAMRIPDVTKPNENSQLSDEDWEILKSTVMQAIEQFNSFRRQEGNALQNMFTEKLNAILALLSQVEPLEKERIQKIRTRLEDNLRQLSEETQQATDRNRLEQEMIYYLEKLDITEEKVRLKNHIRYFFETMQEETGVGKKLGFVAQEMGREINTLGSKSNHSEMQIIVVKMKDILEQIKEQVLNVL